VVVSAVFMGIMLMTQALFALPPGREPDSLDIAQELFYSGRYAEAAEIARSLSTDADRLAVYELRTSALLFQLRRALDGKSDKDRAFAACEGCAQLLKTFNEDFAEGQRAARAALRERPKDPDTLFFLGKLNLNYVWLMLGTLGKKTGWNEYWEARHSLDAALAIRPEFRRARVARAWIDYIVDTRMPWGTGWLLGGGNKKKAMAVMRETAVEGGDYYAHAEALFGLWDMQVREKRREEALETAKRIVDMFPNNQEVARFVASGTR
jgi:tetratricopeptide (TPR) repeat protein